MIKLKDLLNEIADGQGYMTAEKFGSVCLNQLVRSFPGRIVTGKQIGRAHV